MLSNSTPALGSFRVTRADARVGPMRTRCSPVLAADKSPSADRRASGTTGSGQQPAVFPVEALRAPCNALTSPPVPRLPIISESSSDDENEADQAANAVLRGDKPQRVGGGQSNGRRRIDLPAIVHNTVSKSGKSLDADIRKRFESRFSHDFSQVRIHADTQAAESARSVVARAYTVANHIAFDTGQYAPHSSAGASLLAHELAHVVQQTYAQTASLARAPAQTPADGVYVIAVEHGAMTLVRKGQEVILYDAGARLQAKEKTLVIDAALPRLKTLVPSNRINTLAISHLDVDHFNLVEDIIAEGFTIDRLELNAQQITEEPGPAGKLLGYFKRPMTISVLTQTASGLQWFDHAYNPSNPITLEALVNPSLTPGQPATSQSRTASMVIPTGPDDYERNRYSTIYTDDRVAGIRTVFAPDLYPSDWVSAPSFPTATQPPEVVLVVLGHHFGRGALQLREGHGFEESNTSILEFFRKLMMLGPLTSQSTTSIATASIDSHRVNLALPYLLGSAGFEVRLSSINRQTDSSPLSTNEARATSGGGQVAVTGAAQWHGPMPQQPLLLRSEQLRQELNQQQPTTAVISAINNLNAAQQRYVETVARLLPSERERLDISSQHHSLGGQNSIQARMRAIELEMQTGLEDEFSTDEHNRIIQQVVLQAMLNTGVGASGTVKKSDISNLQLPDSLEQKIPDVFKTKDELSRSSFVSRVGKFREMIKWRPGESSTIARMGMGVFQNAEQALSSAIVAAETLVASASPAVPPTSTTSTTAPTTDISPDASLPPRPPIEIASPASDMGLPLVPPWILARPSAMTGPQSRVSPANPAPALSGVSRPPTQTPAQGPRMLPDSRLFDLAREAQKVERERVPIRASGQNVATTGSGGAARTPPPAGPAVAGGATTPTAGARPPATTAQTSAGTGGAAPLVPVRGNSVALLPPPRALVTVPSQGAAPQLPAVDAENSGPPKIDPVKNAEQLLKPSERGQAIKHGGLLVAMALHKLAADLEHSVSEAELAKASAAIDAAWPEAEQAMQRDSSMGAIIEWSHVRHHGDAQPLYFLGASIEIVAGDDLESAKSNRATAIRAEPEWNQTITRNFTWIPPPRTGLEPVSWSRPDIRRTPWWLDFQWASVPYIKHRFHEYWSGDE